MSDTPQETNVSKAPTELKAQRSHALQAIDPSSDDREEFFTEASPLFAGSLFCLIREDPEKLESDPSPQKVIHMTALSEDDRKDYQRAGYGIFFTANAFHSNKRVASNLSALKALYIDIDAPKNLKSKESLTTPQGLEAFLDWKRGVFDSLTNPAHPARETFPHLPTLVVETKNGFHAYWYLKDFIPFEKQEGQVGQEEELNENDPAIRLYSRVLVQLIKLFGADAGAKDVSRVLRSPFSWHLKDTRNDAYPCLPVYFDEYNRANLEDYASCFKQISDDELKEHPDSIPEGSSITDYFIRAVDPRAELTPDEKRTVEAEVLAKYPKRDRPSIRGLMNPTGIPEGNRNASLFCVVSALREDGFSRNEVEADLLATGYNGLKQSEILAVISSAYKTINPRSFGWNDPIASAYRTPEEEAQVTALYRESAKAILEAKKKPKNAAESEEDKEELSKKTPSVLPKPLGEERGAPEVMLDGAQKKIYKTVETMLAELLPDIKYLEGIGWHRRTDGIYAPINTDDLAQKVSICFRALGLINYQTNTALRAKFSAWSSLPNASVTRDKIEPGVGHSSSLSDEDVLPLANGVLNLTTHKARPYLEEEAWRFTSPIKFVIGAECPQWLKFINEITEDDYMKAKQLQEIAGYCLTSSTAHQLGFVLLGEGSNGKSVFTSILAKLLGHKLQSSIPMEVLQSNFGVGNIEGKRLNIVNEISEHYLRGDIFKRLIDGSEIMVDKKNAEHRTIKPFAKFIFTVNRLPQVDETSQAIFRRLMVIKFNRIFRGKEVNTNLEHELSKELSGILNWALVGLDRVRLQKGFTQTEEQHKSMEEFKENSSHLISFLKERFAPLDKSDITYRTSSISFPRFCEKFGDYCVDNNYRKMGTKRVQADLSSLVISGNLPPAYKDLYYTPGGDVIGLRMK